MRYDFTVTTAASNNYNFMMTLLSINDAVINPIFFYSVAYLQIAFKRNESFWIENENSL